MNVRRCCAILVALSITPTAANGRDEPPVASAAQQAAVESAAARGAMMQSYDRAAWLSTDDMLEKLPTERANQIGGWVVTPASGGLHIDYVGRGNEAGRAIYSADLVNGEIAGALVHPTDRMPVLDATARRMLAALEAAREELLRHKDWGLCTDRPPNSIVLPPDADGTIAVYLMTPQLTTNVIPFGGHYRVDIAADGAIKAARAFSNGCINIDTQQAKGTVGLVVSHLLDPQPTEIHVFQQMAAGLPIYVVTSTNKLIWRVDEGRIALLATADVD